jgi:hypothetical protein
VRPDYVQKSGPTPPENSQERFFPARHPRVL